jgi:hypothetical protein
VTSRGCVRTVSVGVGEAVGDGFSSGGVVGGLVGGGDVGGGDTGGGLTATLGVGRSTTTVGAAQAATPSPFSTLRRESLEDPTAPTPLFVIQYHSPQSHLALV